MGMACLSAVSQLNYRNHSFVPLLMKRAAIYFLFALFVVLQAHAPLVHAHVGGDIHHAAGHLDLHETHTHETRTVEMHADGHPTQIVEIAHAIKERGVLTAGFIAILIGLSFLFAPRVGAWRVAFLSSPYRPRHTGYRPSPRAPPSA